MMIPRRKDFWFLCILTGIICAFFLKFFYPSPQLLVTPDFGQSDSLSSYTNKLILSDGLKQNRIPFWTSTFGGGYPIYASGGLGTFYLPNFILFRLLPPIYAYNSILVLCVLMLAWGMYAWFRTLKHPPPIAAFGALTLALSGYVITQMTHIVIIQGLSLFPLLGFLTYRLIKNTSWTNCALLGFVLSQQILVGFPQSVFITLLFLLFYALYLLLQQKKKASAVFRFFLGIVIGIGLSAVQLLPSLEYYSNLTTKDFTLSNATYYSFPFKQLATIISPFLLGNPKFGTYPPFAQFEGSIFWENTVFIGVVPVIILAVGLLNLLRRMMRGKERLFSANSAFFAIVLGVAFLLMTGKHSPLYILYSVWPFNMFRVPSRFTWIFVVALVVLCTNALNTLTLKLQHVRQRTVCIVFLCVLQVILTFSVWYSYHALEPYTAWTAPPSFSAFVRPGTYTFAVGAEKLHNDTFLTRGWQSVHEYYFSRNTFTPDKTALFGVRQYDDYAGRRLKRPDIINSYLDSAVSFNESDATISATALKLLSVNAVGNITSVRPIRQTGIREVAKLSAENSQTIYLYENTGAVPVVSVATDIVSANTVQEAADMLTSETFIPEKSVLRENASAYTVKPNPDMLLQTTSIHDGAYDITVRSSPKRAVLVVAQTYFPGWKARIDGISVPVFPVNIRQTGVELPEGNHRIEVFYSPDSFKTGLLITVGFFAVTVGLAVFEYLFHTRHIRPKTVLPSLRLPGNHGT
jgi:hypothetical protein